MSDIMGSEIYKISAVRVTEQSIMPQTLEPIIGTYIEFSNTGICAYRTYGRSKKHHEIKKVVVDAEIMEKFFAELYCFIHSSDGAFQYNDDTNYAIKFYYGWGHSERFDGDVCKDEESLIMKIKKFTITHGGEAWFKLE